GLAWPAAFLALGVGLFLYGWRWAGLAAAVYGAFTLVEGRLFARTDANGRPARGVPVHQRMLRWGGIAASLIVMAGVLIVLTQHWLPLGPGAGFTRNLLIVLGINLAWASVRVIFIDFYPYLLRTFLDHKAAFLAVPMAVVLLGLVVWLGFARVAPAPAASAGEQGVEPPSGQSGNAPGQQHGAVTAHGTSQAARAPVADDAPPSLRPSVPPSLSNIYQRIYSAGVHAFPGLGREFMPPLDEGSFLYMPTLMPHASIGAALEAISTQDRAFRAIPEVESVVGKLGRAETAIDPAPVSMVETIILYKTEYQRDPLTGELVLDKNGKPIRQWRDHIRSPQDIWDEVQKAAELPGVTGAPFLQPISARLVMLQSGMRAPMGVKVFGHSLEEIEQVGYRITELLQQAPGVAPEAVIPDRVVGKPYLEIEIDRQRIARYGVNIRDVQDVIEVALGGIQATTTVEGRERYPIRVRYLRELRDSVEAIERILVPGTGDEQIPLSQLATIRYVRGPQEIKSEDNFLVSYVLFDKQPGYAEVEVVEEAARLLEHFRQTGEFQVPAGVHYKFAGSYENQVRFQQRLYFILPISLFLLFLLLYFQFRSVPVSLIVFSAIPVAWAGGFIGLWLIAQPWFFNFNVFDANARELLNFGVYNLSAAVWVGFIALFSVTTDDGVVLATYLGQEFERRPVRGIRDIRANIIIAGTRRVRPCLMTSATTVLSLMPVLTSTGRGADVMIPIALPSIGGLSIELLSLFVLPVLYCLYKEVLWRLGMRRGHFVETPPDAPPPPESC
ncbi:MAG: efflux RND transporter permease subunit, partial [Planctomycetota bacterium]